MSSRLASLSFFLLGVGCLVLPFFGPRLIIGLSILVGLGLLVLTDPPPEKRVFRVTASDFAFFLLFFSISLQLLVTFGTVHFNRFGPGPLETEGLIYRFGFVWREIAEQRATYCNHLVGLLLGFIISRMGRKSQLLSFLRGLAWGSFFVALVCLFQVLGIERPIFDNRIEFWIMVKRYQGTLTDPNSFGMMAALVVPLLFELGMRRRRAWYFIAGLSIGIAALWSGSRSYFLMLGLATVFSIISYRQLLWITALRYKGVLVALGLCVGIFLVAALRFELLPVGLQRLFETFNPSTTESMFSSRVIYSQLAMEVWSRTSHLFGAGLGMFYHLQQLAASSLGIDLNGWHDNANNYYLQILSEGGLVGLTLFVTVALLFWRSLSRELPIISALLLALLFTLLTGPHINFNEVLILVCVLLGFGICLIELPLKGWLAGLIALLILGLPVFAAYCSFRGTNSFDGTYGLYQEEGPSPDRFRWSYAFARVPLPSGEKCPKRELILAALKPDILRAPQRIRIIELDRSGATLREQRLTIDDYNNHPLEFDSDVDAVKIIVKPTWSPSESGGEPVNSDQRVLGVVVKGAGGLYCRHG